MLAAQGLTGHTLSAWDGGYVDPIARLALVCLKLNAFSIRSTCEKGRVDQ